MCHCPFIIFFWELNIIVIMLPLLRIVMISIHNVYAGQFRRSPTHI